MTDASKALASITPKIRKQLHQSGAEMLAKCGIAFEFRYVLGIRRPPSAFLLVGKSVDKGVTTDLDHKIRTGELEQESVILDVVRDAVETDPQKDDIELQDDEAGKSVQQVIGETKDKAVRLVKAHHGVVAPTIRPAQVARKFSIDLDRFLRGRAKDFRQQAEKQGDKHAAKVLDQQARYLNVAARDGVDFVGEMDIVERYAEIDGELPVLSPQNRVSRVGNPRHEDFRQVPLCQCSRRESPIECLCSRLSGSRQHLAGRGKTRLPNRPQARDEDDDG